MKRILFLLFFCCIGWLANAQQVITGRIMDKFTRQPVANADILVLGDTVFTTSNKQGYFQFRDEIKDTIVIMHPGYYPMQFSLPEMTVFSVYVAPYDDAPVYLPGQPNFYRYLKNHLKYPFKSMFKKIEGVQLVRIRIDEKGKIKSCNCLNDLGVSCESKILPVIQDIPGHWSPGKNERDLVLPIIFALSSDVKSFSMPDVDISEAHVMKKIVVYAYVE